MAAVNAGARLDRLPISSFHHRIFWLIGAGMFFDGYDLYVGTTVLGAAVQSGFSTLGLNAWFVSLTFLGMTLGSLITGFLGDRFGRRFTYQFNLMIFGLASLAAAFSPNMETLNALRFVMGLRQGAWPRRRDRGRLRDPDRVRTAAIARLVARLHGVRGGLRPAGDRTARYVDHSDLRLAATLRHRRRRRAHRLVPAQGAAG